MRRDSLGRDRWMGAGLGGTGVDGWGVDARAIVGRTLGNLDGVVVVGGGGV